MSIMLFYFRDTHASKLWLIRGLQEMLQAPEIFMEPFLNNWKRISPNQGGSKLITLPPLYVKCKEWLLTQVLAEVGVLNLLGLTLVRLIHSATLIINLIVLIMISFIRSIPIIFYCNFILIPIFFVFHLWKIESFF